MNISEILKALACDNLPRIEVDHDYKAAPENQAVEPSTGSWTHGETDSEDGERDSRFGVCFDCMKHFPPSDLMRMTHQIGNGDYSICGCTIPF